MTKWRDVLLGDVVTLQRGFDLTERQAGAGDVPVISSSGPSYTTDIPKVNGPGVITGRKGVLGKVHWSEGPFWPHDTTLWVRDFKGASPRFIYYLLKTLPLAELDAGAANPTLNRNHAHLLPVRVPDAETQSVIASVLQSFDDLIENSRRRAHVLEEIARAIYREWFVHFRYPGHQDVPLVDSAIGKLPQGWTIRSLGEVAVNRDRQRRPLSKIERERRRGEYPYYGAAKLIDRIDDWLFDGEYLLFAEDGSVQTKDGYPVLQLVEGKFWANNHTHILEGQLVSTRFLALACERVRIAGYVTGAAQPKITQANLNRIPLVIGPSAVHEAFDNQIDPLFDHARNLARRVEGLVALRDLLLPKLVTGQVDVSMLDPDDLIGQVA